MWIPLIVGCGGAASDAALTETASPGSETASSVATGATGLTTGTTGATGTTGITGATGDSGTPPGDCAALVMGPPIRLPASTAPFSFDFRTDGLAWFANTYFIPPQGIYEGTDPASAVQVYDHGGKLVREDPYGNLFWTEPPDVWWVPAGGVEAVYATGLAGSPRIAQDIEVHPSGALILPEADVGGGAQYVTYIDPTGVVTTTETSALPVPLIVRAVAYAHDWNKLWVVADAPPTVFIGSELLTVDVDALGAPDWTTATSVDPLSGLWQLPEDLLVDACGGVLITATTNYLGLGSMHRYDPAAGTLVRLTGNVDHGYGASPSRFGRIPGHETQVGMMSGGWSGPVEWLFWDIGVGAPVWP